MKKINIVAVGKIKERFFEQGIEEYAKRLSRFCDFNIIQLPDKGGIDVESKAVLDKLEQRSYKILLDINGKTLSSPEIAKLIEEQHLTVNTVEFVIGGSEGVNSAVKQSVDFRLSFGAATYPHQLMRLILSEQIYRAFTIMSNMPYHK